MRSIIKSMAIAVSLTMAAPIAQAVEMQCAKPLSQTTGSDILSGIANGRVADLIACGLDVNAQLKIANMHATPLLMAAGNGNAKVVEQILSAGADPNLPSVDDADTVPLEVAVSVKDYAAALLLVRFGARVDQPNSMGMQPLMLLAMDTKQDVARNEMADTLLQRGANINAADRLGNTALHWAARRGNLGYAQWLISKGAAPCERDAKGHQARDVIDQKSRDVDTIKSALQKVCPSPVNR